MNLTRRAFLQAAGATAVVATLPVALPAAAEPIAKPWAQPVLHIWRHGAFHAIAGIHRFEHLKEKHEHSCSHLAPLREQGPGPEVCFIRAAHIDSHEDPDLFGVFAAGGPDRFLVSTSDWEAELRGVITDLAVDSHFDEGVFFEMTIQQVSPLRMMMAT